ncbi:helix-turn-helix domain-containing protein [Barnesiella sp. ET7]|uniref:helix-turn-helix domain-containing protein n=1 Tax=Barnesiella sp. ET7 TaxID=2972460 RepID=UPI0021AC63CB|nr:helix-turn-helix domain-containing protein [Barnesiella sp. ET7]MCR8912174.1 helix-turn-helix domain-containing protein [Barnesiella sp. ET7]
MQTTQYPVDPNHNFLQKQDLIPISFDELVANDDANLCIAPDQLTIILCTGGRKELQINFADYTLTPGSLAFIYPNSMWRPLATSSDFEAHYFSIQGTSAKEWNAFIDLDTVFSLSSYIAKHPHTQLSLDETQVMTQYLNLLKSRYEANAQAIIIRFILSAFTLELNRIFTAREKSDRSKISRQEDILWKFLTLLKQYHKEERTVNFYADKMCISPKHLSSVIKQMSHKTAHEIIADFVTMTAKRLLKTTTMSIQEISDELNFANQSFFGKFFKQNTGQSPSAYRRK